VLRQIEARDFDKGYLDLLGQLTVAGSVDRKAFNAWFNRLQPDYFVYVIEDEQEHNLIGSGTLVIEHKLIRGSGDVGHIEDVVVNDRFRGLRYGVSLITTLTGVAEKLGCYKVILDCETSNVPFYEKCGLTANGVQMVKYFV
jgi:glucosamine-phosphate N-acetyltransferase